MPAFAFNDPNIGVAANNLAQIFASRQSPAQMEAAQARIGLNRAQTELMYEQIAAARRNAQVADQRAALDKQAADQQNEINRMYGALQVENDPIAQNMALSKIFEMGAAPQDVGRNLGAMQMIGNLVNPQTQNRDEIAMMLRGMTPAREVAPKDMTAYPVYDESRQPVPGLLNIAGTVRNDPREALGGGSLGDVIGQKTAPLTRDEIVQNQIAEIQRQLSELDINKALGKEDRFGIPFLNDSDEDRRERLSQQLKALQALLGLATPVQQPALPQQPPVGGINQTNTPRSFRLLSIE